MVKRFMKKQYHKILLCANNYCVTYS
jgi:hypothetical protein